MRRALLAGLLALAAACNTPARDRTCEDDAAPVVDTAVVAYLSMARALHHEANVRESDGDVRGAIAALERLASSPAPRPGQRIPEVEEVLADTFARVADLKLEVGDVDGAAKAIEAGLAHAPDATYFRGHLLEVEGVVEEEHGRRLADAGRAAEAAQAKAHALAALRQAVEIQNRVIESATSRDGGRP